MHVFITGAATGIGEATIDRWLEKDPAASFTIADKNETALAAVCKKLAARGVKAHGIAADITQLDKIPVIIKEAREKLGPIVILINNAGIMIVEDFSQMSWETGKRMLDINLTAPLRLIYEVLPEMIARTARQAGHALETDFPALEKFDSLMPPAASGEPGSTRPSRSLNGCDQQAPSPARAAQKLVDAGTPRDARYAMPQSAR